MPPGATTKAAATIAGEEARVLKAGLHVKEEAARQVADMAAKDSALATAREQVKRETKSHKRTKEVMATIKAEVESSRQALNEQKAALASERELSLRRKERVVGLQRQLASEKEARIAATEKCSEKEAELVSALNHQHQSRPRLRRGRQAQGRAADGEDSEEEADRPGATGKPRCGNARRYRQRGGGAGARTGAREAPSPAQAVRRKQRGPLAQRPQAAAGQEGEGACCKRAHAGRQRGGRLHFHAPCRRPFGWASINACKASRAWVPAATRSSRRICV